MNKHDSFVEELYLRIEDDYDLVMKEIPLNSPRGRRVGEIDLVAVRKGYVDVFEVKCSFRIVKAKRQLAKISRVLGAEDVNYYFYCGSSRQIEVIE